jgi:hypothetical protein
MHAKKPVRAELDADDFGVAARERRDIRIPAAVMPRSDAESGRQSEERASGKPEEGLEPTTYALQVRCSTS